MKIIQDLIPVGNNRRGTPLTVQYITIHETGNSSVGSDAAMHNRFIRSVDNIARPASWHFTVDDHSIYQHVPTSEQAIHAGTAAGNKMSIGIEMCINSDGDFEQTKRNTQWLVGELLTEFNLTKDKIRQHFDWSGKNCPATIRRTNTWQAFIDGIGDDDMNLKLGDKGVYVRIWQLFLKQQGFNIGTGGAAADGVTEEFNAATANATMLYNKKKGIAIDVGQVSVQTVLRASEDLIFTIKLRDNEAARMAAVLGNQGTLITDQTEQITGLKTKIASAITELQK